MFNPQLARVSNADASASTPPASPTRRAPIARNASSVLSVLRLRERWMLLALLSSALLVNVDAPLWRMCCELACALLLAPVLLAWLCALLSQVDATLEAFVYRCLVVCVVLLRVLHVDLTAMLAHALAGQLVADYGLWTCEQQRQACAQNL